MVCDHNKPKWTYGRYRTGNGEEVAGPIRIWDQNGAVIADVAVDNEAYARYIVHAVNAYIRAGWIII